MVTLATPTVEYAAFPRPLVHPAQFRGRYFVQTLADWSRQNPPCDLYLYPVMVKHQYLEDSLEGGMSFVTLSPQFFLLKSDSDSRVTQH